MTASATRACSRLKRPTTFSARIALHLLKLIAQEAIQREAASGQQDPVRLDCQTRRLYTLLTCCDAGPRSEEQAEKPVWNEVPVKDALKALAVPAHLAVGPKAGKGFPVSCIAIAIVHLSGRLGSG